MGKYKITMINLLTNEDMIYKEPHLGKKLGPHSELHKQRISETLMGHGCSEETRRKISEGNLGKTLSEEAINKVKIARAKQIMKPRTEETKEKLRKTTRTKETKEKMRIARSKLKYSNDPTEGELDIQD